MVTDLVFNITDASGLGPRLILSIFGTWRRLGVSRLFMKSVKDRAAFDASIARIVALGFEHLVPSHGHEVLSEGRPRLVEALRERGGHVRA